ncbi:hypothetical protein BN7_5206 [Wickerhamomyces ciferrii]|uniref:Fcf2 pre-rRNA processing C-terminal domain-containing protein n=1 Tax=Wickerhamomyces ciferrii (strain ATCC 14091 / BCRC 22168 / CBS 111 / JCM 3599 / NBRC 0793 / NRRL Y-1031 F-60-10) TaxID=1206466 RepID=K0KWZ5_WICCF|nr:uncharacterized protein BN7_5206 [Wickerhamomyces ciferrii]CCH45623.1 hypothetical protein BN7_5206 [Wickerhamomyces ciferrii]
MDSHHRNQLSPIHETSTTASLTDTEDSAYDKYGLDELFDQLRKSNSNKTNKVDKEEDGDEFSKIKKSIAKLPKIQENDETLSDNFSKSRTSDNKTKFGGNISIINDSIQISKKPSTNVKETSGSKWFDMPKGELTPSIKRDLKILEQRAALDPKRHYKKDKWKTPEFFQIGTIVEGNTEYYSARLKNKEREQTILESVMNDEDTKHYFKRKYDEVQIKKTSGKKAHYKKVKEARRKF